MENRGFSYPLAFDARVRGYPSEYCLPVWCGKKLEWSHWSRVKRLRICLAVSTEYRRVTDRQTDGRKDGQTDILPQHSPRYAYASHGKNRLTVG